VKGVVRGERYWGPGGGECSKGQGVRGSYDERGEPADQENDPCHHLRDDEEDLQYPGKDEYIWPGIEEEEDD